MTLAAQIIDQQVSGIVERHSDAFAGELRLGRDRHRRRAVAFLFLVARTAFDLADEDALDGIVDGGDDFGIDALYFEPPDDGELRVTVAQGKYRQDLGGDPAFPERGVAGLIATRGSPAVGHLPPGRSGGHAPGSVGTKRVTDPVLVAAADGGLSSGSVEHPHAGGIDA